MLQTSNEALAVLEKFSSQLEFRAGLFRKPLDANALKKLHPEPDEVFRAASLSGADSEVLKEYISALAARKVQLSDDGGGIFVSFLTQDGIELLADSEWRLCWQVCSRGSPVVSPGEFPVS